MRKLCEITGEDAMDILAEIVEPAMEIAQDKIFVSYFRANKKPKAVSYCIRNYKKQILTIMALLEGEDPNTYQPPLLRLPALLVDLANDPDLISLFPSLQTENNSGSAMETTEEEK